MKKNIIDEYGWAIFIILVVAGVLAYYGIVASENPIEFCEDFKHGIMECDYIGHNTCECYTLHNCIEIDEYEVCRKGGDPIVFVIMKK